MTGSKWPNMVFWEDGLLRFHNYRNESGIKQTEIRIKSERHRSTESDRKQQLLVQKLATLAIISYFTLTMYGKKKNMVWKRERG